MSARTPNTSGVFEQLAKRIREVAQEEQLNAAGVERFQVLALSPLKFEQLHGDLVLEDGDEDLTIGVGVAGATLHIGDLVWMARTDDQEFHAFDVASS